MIKNGFILKKVLLLILLSQTYLSVSANNLNTNKKVKPCSEPEYHQFDFWIGDWEVSDTSGKVVGFNKIYPILNGCALSENWTSVSGNPGVSYNFFDAKKQKWHQTWIDNRGGALYLDGEFKDQQMQLSGLSQLPDGKQSLQKISWSQLDDGRVKQHWQASNDQGKSWQDVFVGFYQKKKD